MGRQLPYAVWVLALVAVCICATVSHSSAAEEGIHESLYVRLGGIDQYITINGERRSSPVLLLVHGGPADVQSPFRSEYRLYERDFTLVQWDQRGAGRTFGRAKEGTPDLHLDRIVADGVELAQYLAMHLDQKKIWVLGHSWGSVVAVGMVQQRPDLFAGYIGTGQVGGWVQGVRYQRAFVLKKAAEQGDLAATSAIEAIKDFDPTNVQHFLTVGKYVRSYLGGADKAWLSSIGDLAGKSATPEENKDIGDGMNLSGMALWPDEVKEDLFESAPTFRVPVYVIQGREDLFAPTPVAVKYFKALRAPTKRLFIIEGAGHFALVTHQAKFLDALRKIIGDNKAAQTASLGRDTASQRTMAH